ncbi:MAG: hypothetical protein Q9222_003783 [Ikaeria aurantiellina]
MSEQSDNNASDSLSPVGGRPRRERNDSLWKRARRTLGTNSLTFLQPQNKPSTAASKNDDGSASGAGKTTPGKRREQVRHAQRTHRQRTQNYIKTLESEVVRLRGSEGDLLQQNHKLENQVSILRTALILADVPLPAGFEGSPQLAQPQSLASDMPSTVSYKRDDLNHQRLHIDWAKPAQGPGTNSHFPTGIRQDSRDWNPVDPKPLPNLPQDLSLSPLDFNSTYDNPLPGMASKKLDTAEVAVDFVLALEHICMSHLPHPADPPSEDPSNHALMMSTAIVSRAPNPPQVNASWTANGAMIKELLNLSSAINLEGEITPVEAWHRLRQHPGFSRLDRNAIDRIKADLSASVRCCE